MAAFKILTRQSDALRDIDPDEHSRAAADTYLRPSDVAARGDGNEPIELGDSDDGPLPRVILRLPDVAPQATQRSWSRFVTTSRIHWIAIALGGLLAAWLIFNARKTAGHSSEEPAPWANENPAPTAGVAPTWSPPATDPQAPRWRANDTDMPTRPPGAIEPQVPEVQTESLPATPGAGARSPAAEPKSPAGQVADVTPDGSAASVEPKNEVCTARGGQARWDGGAVRPAPSEAVPLGITTPVP